jgi:hypothetical protein
MSAVVILFVLVATGWRWGADSRARRPCPDSATTTLPSVPSAGGGVASCAGSPM